ncbi:MAG: hypothetical protein NPMRTH1_830007 [Nitrosopumilales archaeon]|nr:MAG: hypothetical protein NPMRTH1_830007 [Nitrosopumilales archaeon]
MLRSFSTLSSSRTTVTLIPIQYDAHNHIKDLLFDETLCVRFGIYNRRIVKNLN